MGRKQGIGRQSLAFFGCDRLSEDSPMSVLNPSQPALENWLLASLPPNQLEHLTPLLEAVPLRGQQVLYQPQQPIAFVYFPTQGIVSLLRVMHNGSTTEVAMVGNEGITGLAAFWGATQSLERAVVQLPGAALRMEVQVFKRTVTPASALYGLLQHYT
ncbi:cyclic nucleotide-binding domain-containing protein [Phormidium tenue FACHB-886]|nr:cyclic nucleotide-binding domain-containing protein [Phormidium tenue FACHB-886]